jgi:hypothetical protein
MSDRPGTPPRKRLTAGRYTLKLTVAGQAPKSLTFKVR